MFPPTPLIFTDRRASISLLGCMLMVSAVLLTIITIQLSDLYLVKMKMQRSADLAVLAASVGGSPVISSSAASARAVATALNVATLNGFGSATVSTTGASRSGSYSLTTGISERPSAVTGSWSNGITPTLSATSSLSMIPKIQSDCGATFGGSFQVSGTASLATYSTGCGLASATSIGVSGGSVVAPSIAVGTTAYTEAAAVTGGSTSPAYTGYMYNAATTDTLATNSSVVAATAHLASMATWPYATTIPMTATAQAVTAGDAQQFIGQTSTVPANAHWGALTITGSTLNFTGSGHADPNCTSPTTISGATSINGSNTLNFASGCYIFNGRVTTDFGGAGVVTNFNVNSGADVVFCFQNEVYVSLISGSLNFGNATTYKFIGDITSTGGTFTVGTGTKIYGGNVTSYYGSTMTFGDGNSYFNGSYLINNLAGYNGTMRFGNGKFYLWNGGIANFASSPMVFGTGPYYFYNSVVLDGFVGQGNVSFMGGDYYFNGGLIFSGQNIFSTMIFSTGNIDLYNGGSINVKSPMYLANGSLDTGGGTVSLYGGTITVGAGTLVLNGGTIATTTGAINVSGGTISIASPANSNPTYGYNNLAILSTGADITFSNSNTNAIGGMIYAPSNTVAFTGSASMEAYSYWGTTWCAGIAAYGLTLSDSTTAVVSPCTGMMPTSTASTVLLSQ